MVALFEQGVLAPLPYRAFPMARVVEAFRAMQQSKHIGKVVVTIDDDGAGRPDAGAGFGVYAEASYLVTGGLSGFGLATAHWLAGKGARHLALVGRRGAATPEAAAGIAALEAAGVTVRTFQADITDAAATGRLLDEIAHEMPRLRGVFHAAMVLDDAALINLDGPRLHRALDPKMLGAWNLHRLTLGLPLDAFVLYSSVAAVVGNPGQANYTAGNLYLEALAEHRRAQGLPALAVGWGALGEVGFLARNAELGRQLARSGVQSMTPRAALAALDRLLATGLSRVIVAALDGQGFASFPTARSPRLAAIAGKAAGAQDAAPSGESWRTDLAGLPAGERRDAITRRVAQNIARVLGRAAADLDLDRPLDDVGLDSLMTVELGTLLQGDLGIDVPVMELIQAGSIRAMADRLHRLVGSPEDEASADEAPPNPAAPAGTLVEIEL
jgi:acyl carrier protein